MKQSLKSSKEKRKSKKVKERKKGKCMLWLSCCADRRKEIQGISLERSIENSKQNKEANKNLKKKTMDRWKSSLLVSYFQKMKRKKKRRSNDFYSEEKERKMSAHEGSKNEKSDTRLKTLPQKRKEKGIWKRKNVQDSKTQSKKLRNKHKSKKEMSENNSTKKERRLKNSMLQIRPKIKRNKTEKIKDERFYIFIVSAP